MTLRTVRMFLALCAASMAAPAWALLPREVVIVANADLPQSVELARLYASGRAIPDKNIVLLKTVASSDIGGDAYDRQIRLPLWHALKDRDLAAQAKCLVLMYGVPVRINVAAGEGQTKLSPELAKAFSKAHYRLAVDYELLGTVTLKFPPPRTAGLEPVGGLFESSMPEPRAPLDAVDKLRKNIAGLMAGRERDVASILDPAKQGLARRQLLALVQDVNGLEGLIGYISNTKPPGAPDVEDLKKQLAEAKKKQTEIDPAKTTAEQLAEQLVLMGRIKGVGELAAYLAPLVAKAAPRSFGPKEQPGAAVDSELSLLWVDGYDRQGPARNFLHWRTPEADRRSAPPILMACRIDGPSPDDAKRIIVDSLAAEKKGLSGTFYIDAGGDAHYAGPGRGVPPQISDAYDQQHLLKLAAFLRAHTGMKVVVDEKREVFPPKSCPDAALYVGWYSLRNYVPAFTWNAGAVGWHLASFEAEDLRDPKSNRWCPRMIHAGASATLGPVYEPFLDTFPAPDEFFPLLLTGKWTIAECYWRTTPTASWQMTLIADPLYNPFAANPQVKVADLPPGLAPAEK